MPIVDFNVNYPTKELKLDSIAKSIQYVELESNNKSFISDVNDIAISKNYILILDQKLHNVILFDSEGKFLRKIGQQGKGPGEYVTAFSIDLSDDESQIYIYSTGDKILKYSIDGSYLDYIPVKGAKLQYFKSFRDGFIFTVGFPLSVYFDGYSFGIMDSMGNIKKKLLKRRYEKNTNLNVMVSNSSFYMFQDTVVYWQYIYDTIYSITQYSNLEPRFIINYKENRVPNDAFQNVSKLNSSKKSGQFMVSYLIESKNNIFFTALENQTKQLLVFDKRNQELFRLPQNQGTFHGVVNNIDFGPAFWPQYLVNDSTMCSILAPEKIIRMRSANSSNQEFPNTYFSRLTSAIGVQSNHIIMKITLK